MARLLLIVCLLLALAPTAPAQTGSRGWMDRMGSLPIQDGGRVMPLESYARNLAVQLTGRSRWSTERGPEAYAGRRPMQLLCDLLFSSQQFMNRPLIAVENRPFKTRVGLDPAKRFFTPAEISACRGINDLLMDFSRRRDADPQAPPLPDQKRALDISAALDRLAMFASNAPLPIVPASAGETFRNAGMSSGDPGTEDVQAALRALGQAYLSGGDVDSAAAALEAAVLKAGTLDARTASAIRFERFYNSHAPWRRTATAYGLAIVAFGFSRLLLRRPLVILAVLLGVWGVAEHILGIGLRVAILGRAPVSNTYESLLWMGLIGIAVGLIAQAVNRKGWYLFGGVSAALVSVLFAGLVPLQDQTNALPAVLRSNFWLIIHVLTIVASYGVLAVASVLGHVYLVRSVLLGRKSDAEAGPKSSHPLIVQTYRTIQVGLFLLTAGTILGGVWAADSWGRFWGWDPKETWALISIVIYFAVLHARYIRWLRDFGLAASAVLGFAAIVWTFYGVNYVMATGLHSYGFGTGGEVWVAVWAIAEAAFLIICRWRYVAQRRRTALAGSPASAPPPAAPRAGPAAAIGPA